MKRLTLCLALLMLIVANTFADVETVLLVKVMDSSSQAVIQRRNGEQYLIEYGVGVLSIYRFEGKTVFINSPGLFAGIGSEVILPDANQKARIWNSEVFSSNSIKPTGSLNYNQPAQSYQPSLADLLGWLFISNSSPNLVDVYINEKYVGSIKSRKQISILHLVGKLTIKGENPEKGIIWGPKEINLDNNGYTWNMTE